MNRYIGREINILFKDIDSIIKLLYQCSERETRNILLKRLEKQIARLPNFIRVIDLDKYTAAVVSTAPAHTEQARFTMDAPMDEDGQNGKPAP